MNIELDCLPCFIRQALEAARHARGTTAIQEAVLRSVCRWVSEVDLAVAPPAVGQRIHRLVRELTGAADPYAELKSNFNRAMLERLPGLRVQIAQSPDPFATAVRLAVAGNAIDAGVYSDLNGQNVSEILVQALVSPLAGPIETLRQAVHTARTILYIADNAGEIVLDRLLIEQMRPRAVTVVVRGHPILNDAIRTDALAAGLEELAEVIDNGSDAPGTLLPGCSKELQQRFMEADVIIAKGQGNYETLSAVTRPNVFFLLMAKCPVIARHLGCERNRLIVAQGRGNTETGNAPSVGLQSRETNRGGAA